MSSNTVADWPNLALGQDGYGQLRGSGIIYTTQSCGVCPWYVGSPGSLTDYTYAFVKDRPGWDGVQRMIDDYSWELAQEEAADGTKPDEWVVLRIAASTWSAAQDTRVAGTVK